MQRRGQTSHTVLLVSLPALHRLVHVLRSDFKARLVVLPIPDGINRTQLAVLDDPTLQVIEVVS